MNVEDVQFVTRAAVAAVDFLFDGLGWMRRREGVWEREEDDVLRPSAVAGSVACLSLGRCLGHLVFRTSGVRI